ncbi:MAG TPA: alpha-amylase family glycosyl hydrolase [Sediminibacterium sp.]|nr:alpha-amylase family glycosyl hydrolase [Sediminibacterium sp.]
MLKKFSTVPWLSGCNIYEVNLRQYSQAGSFNAFSESLPRLKAMGVQLIWLMPVTPISLLKRQGSLGSYYACSSYVRTNPEFGHAGDFGTLVQTAHACGIKVIIDWVANHTGWDHEWTSLHPEWYQQDAAGNFTERNGWKDVIDLNYANTEMRQAMISAMRYWVEAFDIDGFRCDMAHLVPLDFWEQAREACDTIKPLVWLAETETPSYHDVFDISYAWDWMHLTEKYARNEVTLADIRNTLHTYTSAYPPGSWKMYFTSNHDENSWNGTEYEKYGKSARAWAVFTATWTGGIPLVYSGQESPNTHRLAFFDKDPIQWNEPLQLDVFYRTLLQWRSKSPAIREGETFLLPSENDDKLMAYLRKKDEAVVLVLLNVSGQDRIKIKVDHPWIRGDFRNLFSGMVFPMNGPQTFELQAGEFFVYVRESL